MPYMSLLPGKVFPAKKSIRTSPTSLYSRFFKQDRMHGVSFTTGSEGGDDPEIGILRTLKIKKKQDAYQSERFRNGSVRADRDRAARSPPVEWPESMVLFTRCSPSLENGFDHFSQCFYHQHMFIPGHCAILRDCNH